MALNGAKCKEIGLTMQTIFALPDASSKQAIMHSGAIGDRGY